MLRLIDFRWWKVGLGLMLAAHTASAFSLLGPQESWQTVPLGYERHNFTVFPSGSTWDTHFTDFAWYPHNLGEEFRWNTPQLYYAIDQSFLDYFGSDGVAAVNAAVAILNAVTNVSAFSANLSEFPLDEVRQNYTATALHLYDLKSAVLELLVERLGLIDPERWTWELRDRILIPGASCPIFDFSVIQRNFDPVTWQPTRYVNGSLFTYDIEQSCPPGEDFGDAIEFLTDVHGVRYSAVATPKITLPNTVFWGYYHTSLTRDDAGGLRYLYSTNNVNWESMSSDSVLFYTNIAGGQQLLITSNLTLLAQQALTNDPVALQALYPTLQIVSVTNIFTNVWVTNITGYFTNYPLDPFGTPPHLVLVTNRTLTVQTNFRYIFGNVVTIVFTNGAWATVPLPDITTHISKEWLTVQTTYTTNSPYDPFGTPPHTNTSSFTYSINTVAGDYYIIPTNLCGIAVASLQATLVSSQTNVVSGVTNLPAGFTNAQSFSQVIINYATNHAFTYYPIECVSTNTGLFQGVDKITFIKANYDSLLGRFFPPITNYYHLNAVSNSTVVRQTLRRVVTQPDIVITAADITAFPYIPTVTRTSPNYSTNGVPNGLAGPGTIQGPVNFQMNKVGPIFLNGTYPLFTDESGALLDFIWGSFDGTTNAPIVYPSGTSIMNLENQVLIQVSPPFLPDGQVGKSYTALIQTKASTPNWQSPYTFGLAPDSQGLPPGLNLSAGGAISGSPTQAGFYNFNVQVTDAVGRKVQQSYVINVF